MLAFTIRRLLLAVPTLLFISLVIFLLLDLAPGDPMAQVPLSVPPEVKERMREALGLGQPAHARFLKWLTQFFWIEPQVWLDHWFGTTFAEGKQRILSWQSHAPVMEVVAQRLPQTLWVVGLSYVVGILIALPIGIYAAYRQYSVFDQAGTFVTMLGLSVPPFFSGPLLIMLFAVQLGWFPSVYDTTHTVTDWGSFLVQLRQMIMPVMVLSLQTTAQISRYLRGSVLDNLRQDYVRTARAKGAPEIRVVLVHVLRNSMLPVISAIAMGAPSVFGGAIITEAVFKVNGIGDQLLNALLANDFPTVQPLTFLIAVLVVLLNILADLIYGVLDPRIRYD
jgi:peptide/nickel transport system permease protein